MKSVTYLGTFAATFLILCTGCSHKIEETYESISNPKLKLEINNKEATISSDSGSIKYEVAASGSNGFRLKRPGSSYELGFDRQGNTWVCDQCVQPEHTLPTTWEKK
ncbi:hypothetical protein ACJ67_01230 [Methylophilus sp. TWE2]|nr:hypothetical protein ACJ67_01230 [Methylophilus sp. TWE2]